MDKQQAQRVIKETFENSFDKSRYTNFVKNLLNHIDVNPFTYKGNLIYDSYKKYITKFERIGKYSDGEKNIDILVITLKKETSLERARTMQRNFVARYLNGSRGGEMKDAALVAYVSPGKEDWRFSLVKMDYKFDKKGKVKEEFTPARRWSFLVGTNEKSHTAQSRLVKLLMNDDEKPALEEIEKSFDIETVTKEFFIKYRELFIRTKEELDRAIKKDSKIEADFKAKGVDTVNFAKKLLGQIIFLYFLQKKGWFGVGRDDDWGTGSKQFLRELFEKKHGGYNNFFNDILEPLFYEALRTGEERKHVDYYYSRFNCKIPFLNGGLFDPIGNYDWVHTDIIIPDKLFSNRNKNKEGDGILDIFDLYNFTVKEDEPLEKEVAIDPELLGKAYEKFNAIRPDNFEEYKKVLKSGKTGEENKFNKKFGVYYTPREIVHYMCQQSLIEYLYSGLNIETITYQKIGNSQSEMFGNAKKKGQLDIITEHKSSTGVSREAVEFLILEGEKYLEYLKTVKSKKENNTEYKDKYKKKKVFKELKDNSNKIDYLLSNITVCDPAVGSGAFSVGMMSEIVRARNVLSIFIQDNNRTPYEFKRRCIEHSLYGVDIDPGAVEITKLRLWLSLVVDEDDIKNIKPLPNLDYKIVQGNSLIGYPEGWQSDITKKIENLKNEFFYETNPNKKIELKKEIDDLIQSRYKNSEKVVGYKINFDFRTQFSEVFRNNGGFDVVIGNPPYVRQETLGNEFKNLMKKNYPEVANGIADLYVYFFGIAFQVFKSKGTITFITPNKYLKTKYGLELRNTLRKYQVDKIIDFFELPVFEAANDTAITIIRNEQQFETTKYFPVRSLSNLDLNILTQGNYLTPQKNDTEWIFIGSIQNQILKKFYKNSIPLKEFVKDKIYSGIKTAFNKAFVLSKESADELLQTESMKVIKKYAQSTAIKKWEITDKEKYFLATGYDIDIPKKYPSAYKFLKQFEKPLKKRLDKGRKWWNLRACKYYNEFEKSKIIYMHTAKKHEFYLDTEGYYINNSCYMIVSDNKFLFCFLNSKLFEWFKKLKFVAYGDADKGGRCKLDYNKMITIPIKKISRLEQQPFITLVDRILAITEEEDYLQSAQKQTKVKSLETEIDQLVYKLYDLTEEEIKIVEGKIKTSSRSGSLP